ncbi:hypothetical protein COW36_04045 [bacterium (Candidatus Blackallbacteria) CG17_big_fil_post_rev_8_21_14_2_50_48_46]|uniref:Spore protein YkvP/CgeB glycosyl transferase-like domain-containing protein n=1 Tax=bacterium (Candidatus Blackallbacteria) CG17_big_fil_post_rev_8_21_14_2_50_48_46 TaxID=2014261 RepID=A0A2M7G8N5_9BACT|nr:MAG: hypothetical protein COW64_04900 [bacterium (Candidatus Blackallbacteria) CG18_big_fil_WC_8_21_14_2_50_49_26]PIW18470.1 MAG: hypothetical protein COW36_04045 [bacterium (Candidatus Blackallbacteria) CG17_big_fil_post_rev_8_21_14_2_50_48_46]PIW46545.1 MAG: hypothetical protein COW20_16635 [bacterium (Candidatus Blackallbacteria) CG13_big_fil_rev_8_21_14_2_50_49_14]
MQNLGRISKRILVGPLVNPEQMGAWLSQPDFRVLYDPKLLNRPAAWEGLIPELQLENYPWLAYRYGQCLSEILTQLEPWQPELILWWGFATSVLPQGLDAAPCPVVLIASDWQSAGALLWEWREHFDLILGDQALVNWLQSRGFTRCAWWPSYGFSPARFYPGAETKCWDLTYVGSLNPDSHPERLLYLKTLSVLSRQYRVCFRNQIVGEDYRRLLSQSRLVFNHALRGEMNLRAYEASACGAVVLQEAGNLEIRRFLTPGESCLLYEPSQLLAQVKGWLQQPELLDSISKRAAQAILNHTYEQQFERLLNLLPNYLKQHRRAPLRLASNLQGQLELLQAFQPAVVAQQPELIREKLKLQAQPLPPILACLGLSLGTDRDAAYSALEMAALQNPQDLILQHNLAWAARFVQKPKASIFELIHHALQTKLQLPAADRLDEFVVLPCLGSHRFQLVWEQAHQAEDRNRLEQLVYWNLLRLKAEVALENEDWVTSLQALEQAQERPQMPETLCFPMAMIYLRLQEHARALQAFARSVSLNPSSRIAWKYLIQLSLKLEPVNARREKLAELIDWAEAVAWRDGLPQWHALYEQLKIETVTEPGN